MSRSARIAGSTVALMLLTAAFTRPAVGEAYSNRSQDDVDPALREQLMRAVAETDSFEDRFDAQVWLADMSHRLSSELDDPEERLTILRIVHQEATRAGLYPELVLAVIDVESHFDRYAISRSKALGLMQVMPFWIDVLDVGDGDMNVLFDIETNVLLGCRILKYYLDMEDGDFVAALARYNGSSGQRWYADRVLERLRSKWFRL